MYRAFYSIFILSVAFFWSCTAEVQEPVVVSVTDDQAEKYAERVRSEITSSVGHDFAISLWASEEMVSDAVGLNVDNQGRVYLSITERRRNSELDIRGHSDWMIESIGLETTEERRDFVHRKLAPERSSENTWLTDFNEDGSHDLYDLTVKKESIFRLEDRTGNGHANTSEQFIRGFHGELTDVAGAVLYHEGDVYMGVSPDLWRIRDTNSDGFGDQKESIAHGFGVNIGFGGHGMSGLTTGPDGRIYWSVGDVGMSVVDKDGERWHYPRQGVIVRSEPDGSNFEVFASGLRNTHEFVFDKFGNLITVDNDGDHAGEHERLVYLVNGSDSGWRLNWQFGKYNDPKNNSYKVLMEEGYYKPRFDGQAAHLLPPIDRFDDGHSGVAYNPGTALSERWRDYFFVGKFSGSPANSGIQAFTLKESGASFELEKKDQILEGILPTSIDFGPDGALYISDWIEGWTLKQKGRIWKADTPSQAANTLRLETKTLLADNFTDLSNDELLELLKHADLRVRKKAQFEIVSRSETDVFLEVLRESEHQLSRIHGVWGLAQIARQVSDTAELLIEFLDDNDSEIRAQTAKMLGDVRYEPAAEHLIPLLKDENARVRFFAAEALGRLAWQPAFIPIVEMLEANDDEDVYLRHGGAIALERIGDEESLMELSGHSSEAVRIAAVVALKRLESPGVIEFLRDEDEFIVTNAARAINDDRMIEEGLNELSKFLDQDRLMNEPLIRRAINASLYVGTPEAAERLASFSLRRDVPDELRIEALETLAVWPEPSLLDRVTGDPRGSVENDAYDALGAVEPLFKKMITDRQGPVRLSALKVAGALNITSVIPDILPLLQGDPSPDVRVAALQVLAALEYSDIENAVYMALEDENDRVRGRALQAVPGLQLPDETMAAIMGTVLENGETEERQTAYRLLGRMDAPEVYSILSNQLDLLLTDDLANEVELDLVLAAESADSEKVLEKLRMYQSQKNRVDSVSVYRESLYGGDANQGREIFYQNAAAQCIRCHAVNQEGSNVGPDLSNTATKLTRRDMLESMVAPNAMISPGYGAVTLTLNNGESVNGMLSAESETELIVTTNDREIVVAKNDIAERRNSPSGMPAMGNLLSRTELRDLVEYLSTLNSESIK